MNNLEPVESKANQNRLKQPMRGKPMRPENEVKTEDRVEEIAKLILDMMDQLTDGDARKKQQIVMQLIQNFYKEQYPNKEIHEHPCYLQQSDFMVLGDLLESLLSVRVLDQKQIDDFFPYR